MQTAMPKFWFGWKHTLLNVFEEATLGMHILNLGILVLYPAVYLGLILKNKPVP